MYYLVYVFSIATFDVVLLQMSVEIPDDINDALVAIVDGPFSFQCYVPINMWLKGVISGKRCAEMIINDVGELSGIVVGGIVGATYGASAGEVFGTIGAVVGGLLGSVAGADMFQTWVKGRTEEIFDSPKEVAVDNAYDFFGLHPRCSNAEINSRYRHLALLYSPDPKGGDIKKWYELEIHLGILHAARQ